MRRPDTTRQVSEPWWFDTGLALIAGATVLIWFLKDTGVMA